MMRAGFASALVAVLGLLSVWLAAAHAQEPQQHRIGVELRGGLEGFRLDISVMSQPTPGGIELLVTNKGDPGYVLIGCFCRRGYPVSTFAYQLPADWPDDQVLFGFRLDRGEFARMFMPFPGRLVQQSIPVVVLDAERNVITRTETSAYDGEWP